MTERCAHGADGLSALKYLDQIAVVCEGLTNHRLEFDNVPPALRGLVEAALLII